MSSKGVKAGAITGRLAYNAISTAKGVLVNSAHMLTGRRRLVTGLALGLPTAYALMRGGAALGHTVGTAAAPYFPQEVRKMNTVRLQKGLDFAVGIRKDMEMAARGPGRPRGRQLSPEEIEQRREAARASAAARRSRAAAAHGVSESDINARGLLRERAYTPRVRGEGGGFREYSEDEREVLTQGRNEDREQARQYSEQNAWRDDDGKIRTGSGQFRRSRQGRFGRTVDRFVGEAAAQRFGFGTGFGRHAAKVISSVKEAWDVPDPASKLAVIGGGIGLALGGWAGSPSGKKVVGRLASRAVTRSLITGTGLARQAWQAVGLGSKKTFSAMNTAKTGIGLIKPHRKDIGWVAGGLQDSFGSSAFLAPTIGYIGSSIGHAAGKQLRDDDFQQRRTNWRQNDAARRAGLGAR
jgi:hypothetical protein